MAYFAKKRISDGVYVGRICTLNAPENEEGYEWESINAPTDVEIEDNLPTVFNKDEFDEWLNETFTGSAVEEMSSVIFRATDKNTPRGYNLLVSYAQGKGVPQNIINAVVAKLAELGANIEVGGE